MGNSIVFGDRTKYVILEGSVGGALLAITFFATTVISIIFCYCFYQKNKCEISCAKCCTACNSCCKEECKCTTEGEKSCEERLKTSCSSCLSLDTLHSLLGSVFRSVKEYRIQTKGNDPKIEKVMVISEKETTTDCIGFWTYFYYIYMMSMSFMWFIAIAIEFSIY